MLSRAWSSPAGISSVAGRRASAVDGKSVHGLKRRRGVVFADGHVPTEARLHHAAAEDIGDVEDQVVTLLRRVGRNSSQWFDWLVVHAMRRHRQEFFSG
jgi:prepilin-type processing-associated H-X9-DG protein